ncbi:hypothetical protein, partial [Aliivibrio sp. 1S128]|uniref:hypothetical protein n=1 Tax=Aliivibrio sp. 1S128 TaxID=1840085 RepID=UPI00159EC7A5
MQVKVLVCSVYFFMFNSLFGCSFYDSNVKSSDLNVNNKNKEIILSPKIKMIDNFQNKLKKITKSDVEEKNFPINTSNNAKKIQSLPEPEPE